MIKILLADDHAMMREGLKRLLAGANDLKVVCEAKTGEEVLHSIQNIECNFLILDITMPGLSGIVLINRIRAIRPELPILILSMHNTAKVASAALQAGANGYLAKDSYPTRLAEIIRHVAAGGRFIDPEVADRIAFESNDTASVPHKKLSPRETQIMLMIASGQTVNSIATDLGLSPKTISTHKARILIKMNMTNTAELVRYVSGNYSQLE